jgi:hypothetical protein
MNNVVFYRYLSNYKDEVEFETFETDSYWESETEFFKERRKYLFSLLEGMHIVTDLDEVNTIDEFTLVVGFDPSFKTMFDMIDREDFNHIIDSYQSKIKKIVFWEMDTDWTNMHQATYNEYNNRFKKYFEQKKIPYKVFSTVMCFKYDNSVGYFGAQNAMTIERLIEEMDKTNFAEFNRNEPKNKIFYSAYNSFNCDRAHFYKFTDDNNLWNVNNIALFSTYRNSEHNYGFNYSYVKSIRGDGNLPDIDDSFLFHPKPFKDEEFKTMDYGLLTNQSRYGTSVFEMIFETMYQGCEDLIIQTSEKLLKPFAQRKSFLTFAYCGVLEELKKLGFKTFDFIFDEYYDNIRVPADRLYYVLNEFKRISEMDILKLENIVRENDDVIEHNYINMQKLLIKWRTDFYNECKYE